MIPLLSLLLAASCGASVPADGLVFDASSGKAGSIELPTGKTVNYTAYEKLYFVTDVEDPTYQYMNVYVPEGATQTTPIFLRTYVGGYMASEATAPQAGDATGRALAEGYVVAIPGSRGRNSKVGDTWTGRAPAAILDLKASIRYLRHFDKQMPGLRSRATTFWIISRNCSLHRPRRPKMRARTSPPIWASSSTARHAGPLRPLSTAVCPAARVAIGR